MNQPEEYEDPQPENITSLCYSCENYEKHGKRKTRFKAECGRCTGSKEIIRV